MDPRYILLSNGLESNRLDCDDGEAKEVNTFHLCVYRSKLSDTWNCSCGACVLNNR